MSDKTYESGKNALKTNIDSLLAAESAKSSSGYETAAYKAYSGIRDSIKGLSKLYKSADAEAVRDCDAIIQLLHYSLYQSSAMKNLEAFNALSRFISGIFGGSLSLDALLDALKTLYAQYQKETDDAQKEVIRQKILALINQYYDLLKRLISELGLLPDDARVEKTDDGIEVVSDSSMAIEATLGGKGYAAWKGELNKSGWIAQSSTIYAKAEFTSDQEARKSNPIRISVPLIGWNDVEYKVADQYWMWNILWFTLFNSKDYSCQYQAENDGSDSSNTSPYTMKESMLRIGSVLSSFNGTQDSIYSISSEGKSVYFKTEQNTDWSNGKMKRLNDSESDPAFTDKSVQIQCEFEDSKAARAAIADKDAGNMFSSANRIRKVEVMHTLRFGGDDKDTVIKGTLEYDEDLTEDRRAEAAAENKSYPKYFKQMMYSILKDRGMLIAPYTLTKTVDGHEITTSGVILSEARISFQNMSSVSISAYEDDDGKIRLTIKLKDDDYGSTYAYSDVVEADDSKSAIESISNAFGGESALIAAIKSASPNTAGAIWLDKSADAESSNRLTEIYDERIAGAASGWYFKGRLSIDDSADDEYSSDDAESTDYSDEYSAEAGIESSTETDISAAISSVGTSGSSTAEVILCIKPSSIGDKNKVDVTCEYDSDADINKTDYGNGNDGLIDTEDKMLFGGEFSLTDADITSSVVLDSDEELLAAYLLAIGLLDPGSDDFDSLLALIISAIERLKSKLIDMLKSYLAKINGAITSVTSARTIYSSSDPNYESEYLSDLSDMYSTASSTLSTYLATDGFDLEDIYDGSVYDAVSADMLAINDEFISLFNDARKAIDKLRRIKGALFPISDVKYGNADFSVTANVMQGILKGTNASYATAASSNSAMLMFSSILPYPSWHAYFQRVAGQINRYGRTAEEVSKDIADGKSTTFESLESYEYLDVPSAQEAILYAMSRVMLLAERIGKEYSPIYGDISQYMRKTAFDIIIGNSANDRFMVAVNPKLASAITAYSNEIGDPSEIGDPNDMPINPALNALYLGASAFNEYDISPGKMRDDESVEGRLAAKSLAYKLILANGAGSAESDYEALTNIMGLNGLNIRDYYLIYALLKAYKELADAKSVSAAGVSSAVTDMRKKLKAALALGKYAFDENGDIGDLFSDQVNDSSAYLIAANRIIDANLDSNAGFESIRYRLGVLGFGSLASLSKLFDANVIAAVSKTTAQCTSAAIEMPLALTTPKITFSTPAKITKTTKSTSSVTKATNCILTPISTSGMKLTSSATSTNSTVKLPTNVFATKFKSTANASEPKTNTSFRIPLIGANGERTSILPVRSTLNSSSAAADKMKALINSVKVLPDSVVEQIKNTSRVIYGDDLDDVLEDDSDVRYDDTMIANAWKAFSTATAKTNKDELKTLSDGTKYAFVRITQDEFTEYMTALIGEYSKLKNYLDDDERRCKLQMRNLFGINYPRLLSECIEIEERDLAELNAIGAESASEAKSQS